MQQILNVAMLTLLLLFMFGVCGMKMCGGRARGMGTGLTEEDNFQDILAAMMLLFQFATGGGMTKTLVMCSEGPADGQWLPMGVFFLVFFASINFAALNLFTAVMLEHFDFNMARSFVLGRQEMELFVRHWHDAGYTVPDRLNLDHAMSPRDRAVQRAIEAAEAREHDQDDDGEQDEEGEGEAGEDGVEEGRQGWQGECNDDAVDDDPAFMAQRPTIRLSKIVSFVEGLAAQDSAWRIRATQAPSRTPSTHGVFDFHFS